MKKEFRLAFSIGDASDDMITEAAPKKTARKSSAVKISVIAACLALVLVSVPLMKGIFSHDGPHAQYPDIEYILGLSSEIMPYSKQYSIIQDSPYSHYEGGRIINESLVGSEIGEVTVKRYIHNFPENKDENISYEKAVLYEIKGISPDIAVCLRYTESDYADRYYRYINPNIDVSSPADYFTKNAENVYGRLLGFYTADMKTGESTGYRHDAEKNEALFHMIISANGTRVLADKDSVTKAISGAQKYARVNMTSDASNENTVILFDSGYMLIYSCKSDGQNGSMLLFASDDANRILKYIGENFAVQESYSDSVTWASTSEISK